MSQTNVNTGGGGGTVYERDGTASGMSMGMLVAIVLGVALLALVAWWTVFQSGWFMPAPAGSTNVTITQNEPPSAPAPSGQTGGASGATSGGTTGGSTTGVSGGATGAPAPPRAPPPAARPAV